MARNVFISHRLNVQCSAEPTHFNARRHPERNTRKQHHWLTYHVEPMIQQGQLFFQRRVRIRQHINIKVHGLCFIPAPVSESRVLGVAVNAVSVPVASHAIQGYMTVKATNTSAQRQQTKAHLLRW